MSRVENAISEIHSIDNEANNNSFLTKLHPLVKLLITVTYIVLLTSIYKYNLSITLGMSVYLIIVSIIGDLSIKRCIKRLKIVFLLLVVIGIANPILDRNVITYIGIIPITTGMISMITLILKGFFAIISSYFLIATTSIENICYALKMIHTPNILITVFMLIYRYMILFLKEVEKIWTAYSMRAPNQKGIHYKVWGSMIGSLMIRSIDRAQIVYESMELRGFNPDTYFVKEQKLDKISIISLLIGIIFLFVIRFMPVFEIIGNVFIG